MIVNNKLRWDGSFLGEKHGVIEREEKIYGDNYTLVSLGEYYVHCIVESRKKETIALVQIVESMLELFGMEKRGHHTLDIDGKKCVMFFLPVDENGDMIIEKKLNKFSVNDEIRKGDFFSDHLRKLVVFCNIMQLQCSGESCFLVRKVDEKNCIPLLCFYRLEKNGPNVSKSMMKKLFKDVNYVDVLKEIVESKYGKINESNITEFISNIREDIDTIINMHDPNYIWYSKCILENILPYLLS